MIKIIHENNETNDMIQKEYNNTLQKVTNISDIIIDNLIESLIKLKENIPIIYLKDQLGSYYFNNHNELEIPTEDEQEDKDDLFNSLNSLQNIEENNIYEDLKQLINEIIF